MKKTAITITSIFLISFFVPQTSSACSYIAQAPGEWYASSEVVFIGEITGLSQKGGINGSREVDFDVLATYEGNVSGDVTLTTGANSAMCGYDDGSLSEGDIWAIFANDTKSFNSVPTNKKFNSFVEAKAYVDGVSKGDDDDKPTICTLQYDPVCGQRDTGIRCVTTPCPSTEIKTYGNTCQLNADKAEFLYAGECKEVAPDVVVPKPTYTPPIKPTTADVDIDADDGSTTLEELDKAQNQVSNIIIRFWNFIKSLFI